MAGGMAYDATSGGSLTLSPFTSTGFNLGANSAGGAAMWSVFEFLYTFTANSNMNAVLSGDTAAEGAVIVMLDNTNSQTMFLRVTGDATAWNSVALALVSGHNYTLVINPGVVNGSTDTGTVLNFAVTAVPAPGAAALVGVAGLVAGRRRRA
jgi:MYXO-CTERM domain-containing protein